MRPFALRPTIRTISLSILYGYLAAASLAQSVRYYLSVGYELPGNQDAAGEARSFAAQCLNTYAMTSHGCAAGTPEPDCNRRAEIAYRNCINRGVKGLGFWLAVKPDPNASHVTQLMPISADQAVDPGLNARWGHADQNDRYTATGVYADISPDRCEFHEGNGSNADVSESDLLCKGLKDFASSSDYVKADSSPNRLLNVALNWQQQDLIDLLVNSGMAVDVGNLEFAAETGDLDLVKLVNSHAAFTEKEFTYALDDAIRAGSRPEVSYLVQLGADSRTAIAVATEYGETGIISNLIQDGANPKDIPLAHLFCRFPRAVRATFPGYRRTAHSQFDTVSPTLSLVQSLVQLGADVNDVEDCSSYYYGHDSMAHGISPLLVAADSGDMDMATYLLAKGAYIDGRPPSDASDIEADDRDRGRPVPLLAAVYHGRTEMVRYLLKHGARADIEQGDSTPAYEAVRGNYPEIAELLAQRGAAGDVCSAAARADRPNTVILDYLAQQNLLKGKNNCFLSAHGDTAQFLLDHADAATKHVLLVRARQLLDAIKSAHPDPDDMSDVKAERQAKVDRLIAAGAS